MMFSYKSGIFFLSIIIYGITCKPMHSPARSVARSVAPAQLPGRAHAPVPVARTLPGSVFYGAPVYNYPTCYARKSSDDLLLLVNRLALLGEAFMRTVACSYISLEPTEPTEFTDEKSEEAERLGRSSKKVPAHYVQDHRCSRREQEEIRAKSESMIAQSKAIPVDLEKKINDLFVLYGAHGVSSQTAGKNLDRVVIVAEKLTAQKVIRVADVTKLIITGLAGITKDLPTDVIHNFVESLLKESNQAVRLHKLVYFVFDMLNEIMSNQALGVTGVIDRDDVDEKQGDLLGDTEQDLTSSFKELALSDDNFSDAVTVDHPKSRGRCKSIKHARGSKISTHVQHTRDKKNKNFGRDLPVA